MWTVPPQKNKKKLQISKYQKNDVDALIIWLIFIVFCDFVYFLQPKRGWFSDI